MKKEEGRRDSGPRSPSRGLLGADQEKQADWQLRDIPPPDWPSATLRADSQAGV